MWNNLRNMFRVLDLEPSTAPRESTDERDLAPPRPGVTRWIDLVAPDAATLELLRVRFDLDPLAIADCSEFGAVSKLEDFERYLFLVIHAFTSDPEDEHGIAVHEIHAFLGETFLITVHDNPVPAHDRIWEKAKRDPVVLGRGPSWALYVSLKAMVDAAEPLVEAIDGQLEQLERAIAEAEVTADLGAANPKVAFRIKRSAVAMRRSLRPMRDTLRILHRRGDARLAPRTARYLRDLADVVERLTERVEEVSASAAEVRATYQALQSAKATDLMKNLTIFSAVFLPLGVLVGFWGQNFEQLPYKSDFWLGVMLVSLVAVPAGLLEWFRRNWL